MLYEEEGVFKVLQHPLELTQPRPPISLHCIVGGDVVTSCVYTIRFSFRGRGQGGTYPPYAGLQVNIDIFITSRN